MKVKFGFQLLCMSIILFGSLSSFAGEIRISSGKTELQFTTGNYHQLTLTNTLSAIQFRDVNTRKGEFTELYVTGYGAGSSVGDPSLPTLRKLIEVPLNATFTVVITSKEYSDYDFAAEGINNRIIPAQASVSKGITDPDLIPFVINESTYLRNEFLGSPLVTVCEAGVMRAVRLARIDISPVQYNPVTRKLRVYHKIEATVMFTNGDISSTLMVKQQKASIYFDRLYNQLGNYQPLNDTMITTSPVTYVIVAPPAYMSALQPFVQWKSKKGFKVIQAYTNNPEVGSTTTSIKNYLHELYSNPPAGYNSPSFVLFVGDVSQIPTFTNNGQATDLRYCEYTNDNIPELFYGRFSANNLTQLQPYIDKVLEYEQYLFPSETWLNEVVMVAGADAAHQMTWGNGQINYGTNYYFNTAHNITSHTYLQPEPGGANYSQQIRTNVSNGVAYANYTAHGSEDGWADPQFSISQIAPLQNDHKYCLMVGNCCLTSKYNVNCFAEEITRAAHKGAIGYIGASNNSYWDEDYWWGCGFKAVSANPTYNPAHLGAYDVTFHDRGESADDWYTTMGQMVVGGNMAVEESSSSSGSKLYYWEIYNLMGDPSVSIYYSVPPAITATYPAVTMVGTASLSVTTEPWAYVALTRNDTILCDARCADSTGIVDLVFAPLMDPGYVDMVITKQNRKPVIDSIQVIPATGPYLTAGSFTVNDSVGGNHDHKADFSESVFLNVTVNNIGVLEATNVTGTIATLDTNVILTSTSFIFDTIPPGGSTTGQNAFGLTVKDYIADQHKVHCTLTFTDGTNTWNSSLTLTLNAPDLAIGTISVLDPLPGGNNNGILDAGETARLKITTSNTGHSAVGNGAGHLLVLAGSTPFILVNNPDYYIGSMPANSFKFIYFDVVANGITPAGTVVNLQYNVTAGQANQYTAQKTFSLTIGQVPQYLMSNSTINTCSGTFLDSGGPNGNYSDGEFFSMTFYPGTSGAKIKAAFTEFSIEPETNCNYDYLRIFNGTSSMSPVIGTYCGTDSPDTVTATNSNGALTFEFHSDYSSNMAGWSANILCYGGPLTLIANAFPATVCQGSSSQLVAVVSGGSGNYSYLWSPSTYLDDPTSATPVATPDVNISYTVTVNDGTTTLTSSPVELTLATKPEAPVIIENGMLLESSIPLGNRWYFNGNLIPNATGQTYTPTASGIYYATTRDQQSNCESSPSNSIYFLMTGSTEKDPSMMVSVFPNPFGDILNISYELPRPGSVKITLLDAFGKVIRVAASGNVQQAGSHTTTISGSGLKAGLYYCKVQTSEYMIVKKVILSR